MRIIVKIELNEGDFENVAKITIAGMLLSKMKITKKKVIEMIKQQIHQKGAFYINFTGDSDSDACDYYYENEEIVDGIYSRFFNCK